jgi:toxin ParE1/3/4
MTGWRITVSPEAREDIRGIHTYIASVLLSPEAAKSVIDRILKSIATLDNFPHRYALYEREPWHSRGLRKMSVGNYLVFYLTAEETNTVIVLRVFYAGRNIEKCLEE